MLAREERLAGQVQQHRGVLADRVEHDGPLALGDHLAHDVDGLGLQLLEMGQPQLGRQGCAHRIPRDSSTSTWLASHSLVPFAGSDARSDTCLRCIRCR